MTITMSYVLFFLTFYDPFRLPEVSPWQEVV